MLKFREFVAEQKLILEDRIQKIKKIFNKISTSHDPLAQHKDSDKIIDHFSEKADPTQNKAYTQWILNRYSKGQIRQEDHPRIREALSAFHSPAVKARLKADKKPTDINQYKSLSDLEDAITPHREAVSGKEQQRQIKSEGSDLIYSGNGVTIHHIKTEEAACAYGAGTKWCTAGKTNNMFDEYHENGPIHVIQHEGRKYQYHNNSKQFMDEKDNSVELKNVHPDIQRAMIESNHPDVKRANIHFENPLVQSEHITDALKDKDVEVRLMAIQHHNVTAEHITHALKDKDSYEVRLMAIQHHNVTAEHITDALKDKDAYVRRSAIEHPNATAEHITHALKDKDAYVRRLAIQHHNVTAEHITDALKDKDAYVRDEAKELLRKR